MSCVLTFNARYLNLITITNYIKWVVKSSICLILVSIALLVVFDWFVFLICKKIDMKFARVI